MSYFRASKSLHVSSTALNQALITSMRWGTGYSAPRRVTSTPLSYHHMLTACSSMLLEKTSKQSFGSEVCNAALWHPRPAVLAGGKAAITLPWLDERWPSPYSRARATVLLMCKVLSTSYLLLPRKWFEVYRCVEAFRLWQQMWRFYRGGCLRW